VQEIVGKGGGGKGDGQGNNDPTGCGSVFDQKNDDGSSMNEAQRRQAEQEAKMAVAQAANAARMQGKLPADLDRLVASYLNLVFLGGRFLLGSLPSRLRMTTVGSYLIRSISQVVFIYHRLMTKFLGQ